MKNSQRFYTYAYLREDGSPYYIGKGKGRRLYSTNRRFKPPKDKSRIIFLKKNLTEQDAFKHERYMIAVFGRKDLSTGILHNRTDGGEGSSGNIKSDETKEKISIANRGDNNVMRRNKIALEKMILTKNKPENKEKQRLIAIEVNNRPEVKEKIRQSKLGLNNPAADKNIYTLKNKFTEDIINGTRFDLIEQMKKLNSNNPSINILTNGDIGYFLKKDRVVKNVKGWTKI